MEQETQIQNERLESNFCRELRSKKYFMLKQIPTEEDHMLDASKHCWCRLTARSIGPDGERAKPRACAPGRDCYRSLFEE